MTPRQLLALVDASRRGARVVEQIRSELDKRKLKTEPDFDEVWVDTQVRVVRATPANVPPTAESTLSHVEPIAIAKLADPITRIGRLLSAANSAVLWLTPGSSLQEATTLMMLKDYSQLPIMQNERSVRGAVTWQTIAAAAALGKQPKTVDDCIDEVEIVTVDTGLFDAIPLIIQNGFVLVKAKDNKIQGIVTVADLSMQFRSLSEPFLLLGQIENALRALIAVSERARRRGQRGNGAGWMRAAGLDAIG
ncbi:MAG TPA: CBS domain-containing protein [Kofleriaceae bacterium]|nr:CBS domain-containing protein [Kofleriaceae bacterium]